MKKLLSLSLTALFALGAAACEEAPAPLTPDVPAPFEAKIVNDMIRDVALAFANPCAGEAGVVVGNLHVQRNLTVNDNHGSVKISSKYNGSGEAGNGTRYQAKFNQTLSQSVDITDGAPNVVSQSVRVQLVSQGSSDNFTADGSLHLTVNANGDVTAAKLDPVTVTCSG